MDLGGRMKQDARIETFIGLPDQGTIQACWLHQCAPVSFRLKSGVSDFAYCINARVLSV